MLALWPQTQSRDVDLSSPYISGFSIDIYDCNNITWLDELAYG